MYVSTFDWPAPPRPPRRSPPWRGRGGPTAAAGRSGERGTGGTWLPLELNFVSQENRILKKCYTEGEITCCTCNPFFEFLFPVFLLVVDAAQGDDGAQCQWKEKCHWSESEPTHYYCWVELDWPAEEKSRESLSQVVKNSLLFPLHPLWSHQLDYFFVRGARRHFWFSSVTACWMYLLSYVAAWAKSLSPERETSPKKIDYFAASPAFCSKRTHQKWFPSRRSMQK